ncbi:hypothetical protein GPN2_13030 [Streptomyces murinus]
MWAVLDGWQDRRFDNDPTTRPVERFPEHHTLSAVQPGGWTLLHERWPDLASRELIMRNSLGSAERAQYAAHPPRGRRQWLLGRIAVKDAVRRWLWEQGEGPVFPAEIRVHNDQAGRPCVTGVHGRTLPRWTSPSPTGPRRAWRSYGRAARTPALPTPTAPVSASTSKRSSHARARPSPRRSDRRNSGCSGPSPVRRRSGSPASGPPRKPSPRPRAPDSAAATGLQGPGGQPRRQPAARLRPARRRLPGPLRPGGQPARPGAPRVRGGLDHRARHRVHHPARLRAAAPHDPAAEETPDEPPLTPPSRPPTPSSPTSPACSARSWPSTATTTRSSACPPPSTAIWNWRASTWSPWPD